MGPPNGSVPVALHSPPVLVDQPVVEPTHQQKVVEVSRPSLLPPHHVMGLGEPAGPPSPGCASVVAGPELGHHPGPRFPRHPSPSHALRTLLQPRPESC